MSWNKEKCAKESLKYNTRTEFQNKSKAAYLSAYRQGWLDEICTHMMVCKKKNGFK